MNGTSRTPTYSNYLSFRYLISSAIQFDMFEIPLSKDGAFKQCIDDLTSKKKENWLFKKQSFVIYIKQRTERFDVFRLGFHATLRTTFEGEEDLLEKQIETIKNVNVIIDYRTQVILIQKKKGEMNPITALKALEYLLQSKMRIWNYNINLFELVKPSQFWNHIEEASSINELSLTLNAPNLPLLGGGEAKSLMKELHDDTATDSLTITLRNQNGKLKILKELFKSYIEYIISVGGKYKIKYLDNKKIKRTIISTEDVYEVKIASLNQNEFDEKEIGRITDEIDTVSDVEKRNINRKNTKKKAKVNKSKKSRKK